MSHLHIPDGVLPGWLVLAGWICTGLILAFCIYRVRRVELARKIPLIGIVSALMIVCMTLPIIPFAYHVNLSVVAGIILGPALAFISIFIVDLIIAMFGHGGITVVGLNTIVIGAEAVLGYYIFLIFKLLMGSYSVGWLSGIATVLSLILSTSILVGVLYAAHVNPDLIIDKEKEPYIESTNHVPESTAGQGVNIGVFVKTALALLAFGWVLEGVITGIVVKYVSGIRPDLIKPDTT
jgi:cobalt/nickel transport system permease protein